MTRSQQLSPRVFRKVLSVNVKNSTSESLVPVQGTSSCHVPLDFNIPEFELSNLCVNN
jgi:hypothetical protein